MMRFTHATVRRLSTAGTPHEKTAIQRQIDVVDRQIDRLVYGEGDSPIFAARKSPQSPS